MALLLEIWELLKVIFLFYFKLKINLILPSIAQCRDLIRPDYAVNLLSILISICLVSDLISKKNDNSDLPETNFCSASPDWRTRQADQGPHHHRQCGSGPASVQTLDNLARPLSGTTVRFTNYWLIASQLPLVAATPAPHPSVCTAGTAGRSVPSVSILSQACVTSKILNPMVGLLYLAELTALIASHTSGFQGLWKRGLN